MATITICDRCGQKANGAFDELAIGGPMGAPAVDICKACARGFKAWWEQARSQPDIGAWQTLQKVTHD